MLQATKDTSGLLEFRWHIAPSVIQHFLKSNKLRKNTIPSPIYTHSHSNTKWCLFIDNQFNLKMRLFTFPNDFQFVITNIYCQYPAKNMKFEESDCKFESNITGAHVKNLGNIDIINNNMDGIDLDCVIHFVEIKCGLSHISF